MATDSRQLGLEKMTSLLDAFTDEHKSELQTFIDHNEFGCALHYAVGTAINQKITLTQEAYALMAELKKMMKMGDEIELSKLIVNAGS